MGGHDAPMPYTPANQAGADSAYYSTLGGLTAGNQATYDTASKGFNDSYQKIVNNPYNVSAQAGVDTASKDAWNAGAQGIADAGTLGGYAPYLTQYGFDPNFDNYNWGMRGAQDTANVNSARAGIAGSPFAAGLANDAGQSFTRQYNEDRYGRAQQALAALGQLFTTRQNMAGKGAQQEGAAAIAPMQQYNDVNFTNMQALQALVDGLGAAGKPLATDVQGYGNYLQLGQQSTEIADNATKINNSNPGILGAVGQIAGMAASAYTGGAGGGMGGLLSLFG